MPDSTTNRVYAGGKKTKREIYDDIIEFKYRHKNPYHWYYEDDLDGFLDQPKPDETDSIPAKFPGVDFDVDKADEIATYQEVSNDNTMAAGTRSDASIVHGTPQNDVTEGTVPPLLSYDDNNIKNIDMPENKSMEIIDVDADNATDGEQEDPTDENPGDNPSQNQDGVSNTSDDTAAIYAKDRTKDHVGGDNPKVSIKVEYVDGEYDVNDSDGGSDKVMYHCTSTSTSLSNWISSLNLKLLMLVGTGLPG